MTSLSSSPCPLGRSGQAACVASASVWWRRAGKDAKELRRRRRLANLARGGNEDECCSGVRWGARSCGCDAGPFWAAELDELTG